MLLESVLLHRIEESLNELKRIWNVPNTSLQQHRLNRTILSCRHCQMAAVQCAISAWKAPSCTEIGWEWMDARFQTVSWWNMVELWSIIRFLSGCRWILIRPVDDITPYQLCVILAEGCSTNSRGCCTRASRRCRGLVDSIITLVPLHDMTWHCTTLHDMIFHSIPIQCITWHDITLHYIAFPYIALNIIKCITLHIITLY